MQVDRFLVHCRVVSCYLMLVVLVCGDTARKIMLHNCRLREKYKFDI